MRPSVRPKFSGFMINGASDKGLSGGVVTVPNADIVQEFQELTLNMSAQYGNSASAIINVVTKSGTNALHGSAYEFIRNNALDANPYFFNKNGVARQPLHFNQFGGTITGPVWKDHVFFTASYQGERFNTVQQAVDIQTENPDWVNAVNGALPNSVASKIYSNFKPINAGSPSLMPNGFGCDGLPETVSNYVNCGVSSSGAGSFSDYLCPTSFLYPTGFGGIATKMQAL